MNEEREFCKSKTNQDLANILPENIWHLDRIRSRDKFARQRAAHCAPRSSACRFPRPRERRTCRRRDGRRHDGRSANFRQNVARFRLYRHRSLQVNTRFSAFFKIYQIIKLNFLKFGKILQILRHLQNFCWIFTGIADLSNRFFAKILRLQRCTRMQIL